MIVPENITSLALNDRYFDLKGLSEYSAIGVSSLRSMIKGDGLPHYKMSGKILVKQSDFDKWMRKFHQVTTKDLDDIVDKAIKAFS